jgi:hypothetical protein
VINSKTNKQKYERDRMNSSDKQQNELTVNYSNERKNSSVKR